MGIGMSKVEIAKDVTGKLSLYIDDVRVSPRSSKPTGGVVIEARWDIPIMEVEPCPECGGTPNKENDRWRLIPCDNCKKGWVLK